MIERVRSTAMNFSAKWMKNLAFHSITAGRPRLARRGPLRAGRPRRNDSGRSGGARELGRDADSRDPRDGVSPEEERHAAPVPFRDGRFAQQVLEGPRGARRPEPHALAAPPLA